MNIALIAGFAGVLVLAMLFVIYKMKSKAKPPSLATSSEGQQVSVSVHLVNQLNPLNQDVVQGLELEQKDSLDEQLHVLTKKLAEQEGRLLISKSKIRETQHEIDNFHTIDKDLRGRYNEMMESLKTDLMNNERHCARLQDQIEWVSRRRAEIRDEVHRGEKQYGKAAVELAANLTELQKGRITDKPNDSFTSNSFTSHLRREFTTLRLRKDPHMVKYPTMTIKSPQLSSDEPSSILL